ncbi:type III-B CRISPR module RAMP protein Cmr6 [Alicyclobacillus fructus]|uniref:type III-B CRISPR module RAMP protein Cmr6 n=1 Tax=Alicyclobacillus fructus TaxID=2816082 RepID=UPI001F41BB92|nr:type III-B CRISPR module RAMP protein Cmr6 [Alicyclobacillus fructus]
MRDVGIRGPLAESYMWKEAGSKIDNPGLVFYRYGFVDAFQNTTIVRVSDEAKESMLAKVYGKIADACGAAKDGDWYPRIYQRATQVLGVGNVRHRSGEIEFAERLAVGLGRASVYEVGLAFHPVYGVPYIPASTLKGLVSHFVHEVVGKKHSPFLRGGEAHRFLFGTVSEGAADEARERGALIFYDALIKPEALGSLRLDVMTVHYPSYYRGQDTPHGMDDPIPIYYLSLDRPTFLFRLGMDCEDPKAEEWLAWSWDRLMEALSFWGVGGKKSSGLGRAKGKQPAFVAGESEPPVPRQGDILLVRRIDPPEGKQGIWFETVNPPRLYGVASSVTPQMAPEIGGTMELKLKRFRPDLDPERVEWERKPQSQPFSSHSQRMKGGPKPKRF